MVTPRSSSSSSATRSQPSLPPPPPPPPPRQSRHRGDRHSGRHGTSRQSSSSHSGSSSRAHSRALSVLEPSFTELPFQLASRWAFSCVVIAVAAFVFTLLVALKLDELDDDARLSHASLNLTNASQAAVQGTLAAASWRQVFAPVWIGLGLVLYISLTVAIRASLTSSDSPKALFISFVLALPLIAFSIVLAALLDGDLDVSAREAFIPLFLFAVFSIVVMFNQQSSHSPR
ncbi:hypothetical protein CAOG_01907 [Capsaspora owczarzaki ATCC 30864]|uniref:Transmembrane protein n=1 Tax=Capsaspora owczarzaki (strain ATCC 30864) TaxID=595528 RepID=A0A0D2WLE0_CAPO3|nr:hypothetical protein CAOG_01907 [Capsaspora owczarzaki ATCC 30864]KJE90623.1 hypothetical protein CAOG_001907 [Capsaspora owczarzaki ATCC 30864]|eukprot:XP_004364775.1 hypothetical protein CAOG_01907 [Capsaspora owczarzaki ATCC 30864]